MSTAKHPNWPAVQRSPSSSAGWEPSSAAAAREALRRGVTGVPLKTLREIGGNYVQAGLWRSFAVRDGNLITGQQNFSGEETARLVVEALGR